MKEYKFLAAISKEELEGKINALVKEVTEGWELLPETLKVTADGFIVLLERSS